MPTTRLPWVDEDSLARDVPAIFHYTRKEFLPKILSSGGLLARHFGNTNDAEELRALGPILADRVHDRAVELVLEYRDAGRFVKEMSDADAERLVREDALMFHETMVKALPLPPYITSFSRHDREHHKTNGRLTLWRLYGGDGEGVALGFNTAKLAAQTDAIQKMMEIDMIYLEPVLYAPDDPNLLRRLQEAPELPDMFIEYLDALLAQREHVPAGGSALSKFLVLACGAKVPDFIDEAEVRLIALESFPERERGLPRAARIDDRLLLPYLNALESVMVGPSRDQETAEQEVRAVLESTGYGSIEVVCSQTPFRFAESVT